MDDETLIRDRVMAYLTDRHRYEVEAKAQYRGADQTSDEYDAWRQRYFDYQRRHRAPAARQRVVSGGWSSPPSADPASTEIVDVTISGDRAVVRTLEIHGPYSLVTKAEGRYVLELADGEWLLVSRWLRRPGDSWAKGELD